MTGLLIIVLLFGLLWFLMIRPQRARQQEQQRMLESVAVGDEILTVGGIYGIVQELEPEEDGADLVVEIADGIHVRVARKALATVVKPDDEDDDEAVEEEDAVDEDDAALTATDGAEPVVEADAPDGVEEVRNEKETVNPGVAGPASPQDRS